MKKKLLAVVLVLAFALSLTGCAKESGLDAAETVAVLDDATEVALGEVSLLLRYQQAQMETYYGSFMGSNVYGQDMGDGTLYGDTAKTSLMDEFEQMYILEAEAPNYGVELTEEEKAAAAEAAEKFLAANTDKTKDALAVTQETAEHVLVLMALNEKMYDALTVDVDREVSDEEAAQKTVSYVYMSASGTETDEEGNLIDLTEEEKAAKKAELQEVLDAAKESGDLAAAAEEKELTASTASYGADGASLVEEVRAAADTLEDGEFAEIVETESGYYAVQMISTFDREATDAKKESIVMERQNELFEEKYARLQEAHTFTVDENVLAKLTFERTYMLKAVE